MREHRGYVRSNGLVLVNYKIPDLPIEGKSSAYDVSGTGLRIIVERQLKPGLLIEMEIYLPGSSQPILTKGKTVWSSRCKEKTLVQDSAEKEYYYVGVNFATIEESDRKRIIDYVYRKLHQVK